MDPITITLIAVLAGAAVSAISGGISAYVQEQHLKEAERKNDELMAKQERTAKVATRNQYNYWLHKSASGTLFDKLDILREQREWRAKRNPGTPIA